MAKTIVLADDSPTIHRIVELTFSETEIRVESVTDGAGVVDLVARLPADLLLADVALPHGTGYEICRRVKASARPIPVLLLGGTFEPVDRELVASCGADGHLIKPFEPHALRARVEELLAAGPQRGPARPTAGAEPAPPPPPRVDPPRRVEVETGSGGGEPLGADGVSPQLVDAVARLVVERLSDRVVREIARDVVPDLARTIIRERIRELEGEEQD